MSWLPALILATAISAQDQQSPPAGKEAPSQSGQPASAKAQTKDKNATTKDKDVGSQTAPKSGGISKPAPKTKSAPDKKPVKPAPATAQSAPEPDPSSDGVEVLTQAEMDKRKSNRFLLLPGSDPKDRYSPDESIDWSAVPPWRKTSFFGVRERGLFFVYVVDSSGSMIDEARLTRATVELRRSVLALQPPQRFEVIFYNHESNPMPGGPTPRTADTESKNLLMAWLRLIEPDGGTDPRAAMRQALALKPDAVFLLSDGAFPAGTVETITEFNPHKIPIHCIDLTGGQAGDHLRRIAAANRGRYVGRPAVYAGGR
jgi:hypothetical protein